MAEGTHHENAVSERVLTSHDVARLAGVSQATVSRVPTCLHCANA